MSGLIVACLKEDGTIPDESDKLNSFTRHGRRTVRHFFSRSNENEFAMVLRTEYVVGNRVQILHKEVYREGIIGK